VTPLRWFPAQLRGNRPIALAIHYVIRAVEVACFLPFLIVVIYVFTMPSCNLFPRFPFPLADAQGVVVDSQGHVFVGIGFFSGVQVYDKRGNFLRRFRVESKGGAFQMQLGPADALEILPYRTQGRVLLYRQDGTLLGEKSISKTECKGRYRRHIGFVDESGQRFILLHRQLWPKVERIEKDGQISLTIQNPWYYFPIAGALHIVFFASALQLLRLLLWGKQRKPQRR